MDADVCIYSYCKKKHELDIICFINTRHSILSKLNYTNKLYKSRVTNFVNAYTIVAPCAYILMEAFVFMMGGGGGEVIDVLGEGAKRPRKRPRIRVCSIMTLLDSSIYSVRKKGNRDSILTHEIVISE